MAEATKQYPEHEKLRGIKDQSQVVGEFIEWLNGHGYYICERREPENTKYGVVEVPETMSRKAFALGDAFVEIINRIADNACAYWPTMKRLPEKLLAEYFEIDENKLEDEKRAMLDAMREMNAKAEATR